MNDVGCGTGLGCTSPAARLLLECVPCKSAPSRQVTMETVDTEGLSRKDDDLHDVLSPHDDVPSCDEEKGRLSPTAFNSNNSDMSIASETKRNLILVDWDDTLFPTSYVWSDPELKWDRPAPPQAMESLREHTSVVEAFLRYASELGTVFIITLAERPWVCTSVDNFMPDLRGLLEDLEIEVIYAREKMSEKRLRGMIADEMRDGCQALKTAAMLPVFQHGAWTNAISLGDSDAEFYSIQDVVFHQKGATACACKAVKLTEKPDLETITSQLEIMLRWLPSIINHSGDLELDFEDMGIASPSYRKANDRLADF